MLNTRKILVTRGKNYLLLIFLCKIPRYLFLARIFCGMSNIHVHVAYYLQLTHKYFYMLWQCFVANAFVSIMRKKIKERVLRHRKTWDITWLDFHADNKNRTSRSRQSASLSRMIIAPIASDVQSLLQPPRRSQARYRGEEAIYHQMIDMSRGQNTPCGERRQRNPLPIEVLPE